MASKSFVKVYLVDNSAKTVAIDKETTTKELVSILAEKLELTEKEDHFSLYELRGDVEKSLLADQKPFQVMQSWSGKADHRFLFKRQFIMSTQEEIKCETCMNLMYIQTRDDILKGKIYVPVEQAAEFAGLSMQATYGDYNQNRHVVGFLEKHIAEFIPAAHLKAKRIPDWEDAIYVEHGKHKGLDEVAAQKKYLELAAGLSVFGITTYPCKYVSAGQRRIGQRVFIGVSAKGLHILNFPTMDGNGFYSYNDILSWGSSHSSFTFNTGDRVNYVKHTLETRAGKEITDQVAGYVQLIIATMNAQK